MIRKLVVLIFVAVLCLSSCGNKNAVTSFTENTDDGLTIEEIWEIKDQYDFVYEMDMYLAGKCNYGDEIQKLNGSQRIVYLIGELEAEVNNGGFWQYFYNSSGNFANEIIPALKKINAVNTAEICKNAMVVFDTPVLTDREERMDYIDENIRVISEIFDECDTEFFKYEDDLALLRYDFIIKNKDDFRK